MSNRFTRNSRNSKSSNSRTQNRRSNKLVSNPRKRQEEFRSQPKDFNRDNYSKDAEETYATRNYPKGSRDINLKRNLTKDSTDFFKEGNKQSRDKSSRNINVKYKRELAYSDSKNEEPIDNNMLSRTVPPDLIWGRHSTESVLLSGRPIHRIWCTSDLRSTPKFFQLLRDSKSTGVLVEEVSWSRLGQLTKGAVHQGIVLQVAASKTLELNDLIEACKPIGDSSLLLALDGLTDPHNLGAIVRSAEALGAHGLVLPQRRSAGLTGSVAKVAAGALEHLPVARVVNLNRALEKLKNSGYTVIGLAEDGDFTLPELVFDGPIVVVTGSEDKGISLLTKRNCDKLVRIPLRGVTTNLNASVATSVCLYEVARKRWMRTLSGQAPSPRIVKPQFLNKSSD